MFDLPLEWRGLSFALKYCQKLFGEFAKASLSKDGKFQRDNKVKNLICKV